ncbi:MAG TPA: sulfite exporter TauE/SafE family protein, partial [Nocardioidaceae bacterium]|nr:sulfite exporter TauE/SafE family protein [Nocardioidaceae bacterium]
MDLSVTLAIVLALSLLIGVSLGVLGGGGSILTVPILVYVAGMEPKEAIAASLFVVGVTSAAGAISHARGGRVRWRTGLMFGAAGLVGAFLGGMLGGHLPGELLLVAFALMMVATSIAMIRGRKVDESKKHSDLPVFRVLLDGLVVGLVTGLVGAGGGFLVVPALALLGGLPMAVAVGTSLLVIAMKSLGGLAGYLS